MQLCNVMWNVCIDIVVFESWHCCQSQRHSVIWTSTINSTCLRGKERARWSQLQCQLQRSLGSGHQVRSGFRHRWWNTSSSILHVLLFRAKGNLRTKRVQCRTYFDEHSKLSSRVPFRNVSEAVPDAEFIWSSPTLHFESTYFVVPLFCFVQLPRDSRYCIT